MITIFIIILTISIIYTLYNTENKNQNKYIDEDIYFDFQTKKLFSKQEYKFFKILNNFLENKENKYYVLTKVRLADFIQNKNFKDFTKISQKHIDFIILDSNLKIKLLIELDGYSHNYKKTIKNDEFKNYLFNSLKLPFIRFNNSYNYNLSILNNYI